ncbi:MAG TPA: glycosyltransferase [Solirubrobacterales bacterium]|nr:glycosyltransferase [Solirubrobacterales bacterium]
MSPPIVQYWDSESPPDYIAALVETFRSGNPDAHHILFHRSSAERFIADRFSPREVAAFRACAVPAMQSDYLRYCAVLALGGIYCDVGYRCIAPLHTFFEGCGDGRLFQRPAGQVVNGFFGFAAPGHPLLELTLETATANIEKRSGDHVWQATGPAIFTALWWLRELGSIEALRARSREALKGNLQPAVAALEALAPDCRRLLQATDRMTLDPIDDVRRWLAKPEADLPYKQSPAHWVGHESPIFRDDVA